MNQNITDKLKLRKKLHLIRQNISHADYNLARTKIKNILINQSFYKSSQKIAAYLPTKYEIDIIDCINYSLKDNKKIYLPVINHDLNNRTLNFIQYHIKSKLKNNYYNIQEPEINDLEKTTILELDLILVPTLGFDKKGNRLGMGGGYYDCTLNKINSLCKLNNQKKPLIIGVCFANQEEENIPVYDLDYKLDGILTENYFYST